MKRKVAYFLLYVNKANYMIFFLVSISKKKMEGYRTSINYKDFYYKVKIEFKKN